MAVDVSGFQSLGDALAGGGALSQIRGMQTGLQLQDLAANAAAALSAVPLHNAQTQAALANARAEQQKNLYTSQVATADPGDLRNPLSSFFPLIVASGLGGSYSSALEGANKAQDLENTRTLSDASKIGTPAQTAAMQGLTHKIAGPVTVPKEYTVPAGVAPPKVEETPGGQATIRAQDAMAAYHQPFSTDESDLLAALAEHGISIPSGMRSRQQIQSTLAGLIARNPGKSADDIAEMIGTGQIDFGAEKKASSTAAGVAGRVSVAQNEILQFAPLVRQASAAVPRGSFMPVWKLLQTADTQINDPNLLRLKISINALLNAYNMLAARAGSSKQERLTNDALITSATSPEALETGLQQFEAEAAGAERAAQKAMHRTPATGSATATDSGATPPLTNAQGWRLMVDAHGNRAYVSPDGKQFQELP